MKPIHKKFNLEQIRGIEMGGLFNIYGHGINDMRLPILFWANDPYSDIQLNTI